MRRPRWIGLLLLALLVSGIFAFLGKWQLERAVTSVEQEDIRVSETEVPLTETSAVPNEAMREDLAGQRVSVTGEFAPDDFVVVGNRENGPEGVGYWVSALFLADTGETTEPATAGLAVALGWTAEMADAERIAAQLARDSSALPTELHGRYIPGQTPVLDDVENGVLNTMSPASFVNSWSGIGSLPVYNGFIVLDEPQAGLNALYSPVTEEETTVNWLNIFYSVEWVIFAGFAVFLWFRLTRDGWEREIEEMEIAEAEEAEAGAAAAAPSGKTVTASPVD